MRKPVFFVSDPVQQKLGCLTSKDGLKRLELSDLGSGRIIYEVKRKALIIIAQLITTFVLAYAKRRFSHVMAHLLNSPYTA